MEGITHTSLPPCNVDNLHLWFSQVEIEFQLRNITSFITNFHHILHHLRPELTELVHILTDLVRHKCDELPATN